MLPYSSSRGRHAAPPLATASTGCPPLNQLHTSILCRCCSTIWSPQIDPQEAVPVALLEFQVAHPRVALPVGEELAVGEIQHRRPYPVGVHLHGEGGLGEKK